MAAGTKYNLTPEYKPEEFYLSLIHIYEDKEKFIILITGGRGSGKSFNASTLSLIHI